jgi:hypothetical protein
MTWVAWVLLVALVAVSGFCLWVMHLLGRMFGR